MEWDAKKYNTTHDFIFKYGAGLLALLPKEPKKVLDIGSGTGALTNQIAELGHKVTGIDQSANMINQAKESYPDLNFLQEDILNPSDQIGLYDIAFSNAVFHWITDQELLVKNISEHLNVNGQLICEFGAVGNVQAIREAFGRELKTFGQPFEEPFCFTSITDYRTLLKKHCFEVVEILEYDRPTPLKGGRAGLREWMEQFYTDELGALSGDQKEKLLENMERDLAPRLWKEDHWEADYRRLKIKAVKI
ncbi:methyltransferase [Enterococcus plantarum]|uniref:class I SAM-dependent methyltransferase n=1 Tax=Enterococcus plantarum TaxID=1077675 RepID=UPI00084D72C1|nr:methyltransferase domain-containing protein [Enterococcus plantarum]MBO0421647.1 methyltransferase domain-containing protein [Enterococcus plantarum]OEG10130.1 methyltransferase [Enterococcus plantarum]